MNKLIGKRLCAQCVSETFLRAEVIKSGTEADCSYCAGAYKTLPLEEIAKKVETAVKQHYRITASEPSAFEYSMLKESSHDWEREGEPVAYLIASAVGIEIEPAEHIRQILAHWHFDCERDRMGEQGPFDLEAHYIEKGVNDIEFQIAWSEFETHLKTEARYFSRQAQKTLDEVSQAWHNSRLEKTHL